jgi:hypothetical protein
VRASGFKTGDRTLLVDQHSGIDLHPPLAHRDHDPPTKCKRVAIIEL